MGATRKKMTFKGPSDGSLIELMPKTTGDQVYLNDETPLTPKIAEMVSAINLREKITDHIADVETLNETIDTKVADAIHNSDTKNSELKTYIDDNMAALNESMTSSHSTINSSIEAANAEIALRAKQTDVDTAISTLSNSVESKLADKANTADVETKIANLKQEILGDLPSENYDTFTEMAAYIAEHQDLTDALTEAINTKANKTDVNASLDLKANKTDVDAALAGKVNTSDLVDPGNGTISLIQGGVVKGSFTMNQSGNAEINLDNNNPTYYPMVAASATEDGKGGLVPAPAAGKQLSYLRGDGTWAVPTDTKPTLDSLGISATAAEINQLGGVTSNVQVQLDSKVDSEYVDTAIANAPKGDTGVWISQAEYDALSDNEKNSDTTYYIYDADTNPNAAAIPFTSANYTATNVGDALEEIKADVGYKLRVLTQEEYDALETVDPSTIYFIS